MAVALAARVYAQAIPEDVAKASADLAARQAEAIARAQQNVAQEAEATAHAITPLGREVVLSCYQGDTKVSSLPDAVRVNAGGRSQRTSLPVCATVRGPAQAP